MHRTHVSAFLSVALLSFTGCAVELADDVGAELADETAALTATGIKFSANSGIPDERCRVHDDRLAAWPAGSQLLIYRGTTLRGVCTVQAAPTLADNPPNADTILMSREMMVHRVWSTGDAMDGALIASDITGVTVRNETPASPVAPRLTASVSTLAGLETDFDNTVREYTVIPTAASILVGYVAPHPTENPLPSSGFGKSYLGWKAAHAKADAARDAFWTVGWRGNRGHCENDPEGGSAKICDTKRFHVTGTEINFASFPGLASLQAADLDYVVALHGQGAKVTATCNTNIMVGGLVGADLTSDPLGFRRGVAENLRMFVPPEVLAGDGKLVPDDVKYSPAGNALDGCNFDQGIAAANFHNVLAEDGAVRRGLQLEQGSLLDSATYQAVGESVHQVFDCLNAPADVNVGTVAASFAPQKLSATYATDPGRCNGFVVDATFSSASNDFFGGLQTCQVGAKVHLDVYRRNPAGSYDRVAGGTRTYTACSPAVFTDATYDDDNAAPAPAFQHALTGAAAAGSFRLVIHGYSGTHFTPAAALPVFGQAS